MVKGEFDWLMPSHINGPLGPRIQLAVLCVSADMFRLIICLLAASLAVNAVTDVDYGLGTVDVTKDYMLDKYDVVIFVNDEMYNLGPKYDKIEAALTRYNGVRFGHILLIFLK